MHTRMTRTRLAVLGAVFALLLGTRPSVLADAQAKKPCCFANPSYAGVCEVQPAADETCASILAYLNNPSSSGKGYCSNTDVRGGWTRVTCKPSKKQAPGS